MCEMSTLVEPFSVRGTLPGDSAAHDEGTAGRLFMYSEHMLFTDDVVRPTFPGFPTCANSAGSPESWFLNLLGFHSVVAVPRWEYFRGFRFLLFSCSRSPF